MPDVARTKSDLVTNLFQDGQTAGISAQDMRDMIESLAPAYGGFYVSTAAATTIAVAGTYVKMAGTTTTTALRGMDDATSTSNRLRYTGTPTRQFHAWAHASISPASGTNQVVGIQIWHYDASGASGALLVESEMKTIVDSTGVIEVTCQCDVALDTNDYLEIHVANHTGTPNLTADLATLFAQGIIS